MVECRWMVTCRVMVALVAVALLLGGCERGASEASDGEGERRLVSLAPGLTQMVVDLGLGDQLVGVGEHDAAAPAGLPVVGNYADVNTERLIELAPTHVLTLATVREAPRRLRDLAAAGQFELVAYPFPYEIDDVRQTLHRDGDAPAPGSTDASPPPLGELLGVPERGRELSQQMIDRLEQLRAITADRDRPRVLMVIGSSPIMASGPGTVHDELLGWIGARNAAHASSVTAPTYDRESLLAVSPDVILLLSPGSPALADDDPRLAPLQGLPIPAIEEDRVHVVNDPLTLLASSSLPRVAAAMAEAIYPDLAGEIEAWREAGESHASSAGD
ncbi:MAG: ABC transporter substrate-binding protein [Phycisphaeraceae bacterium]